MDGYVTIGTSLDTQGLKKDLKNAERELRQYEKEAEKLTKQKAKIEVDVSDFEAARTLIQQQTDESLKNAQTQEQVNFLLEMEEENLKTINAAYEISKDELNEINQKIKQNASNQQNVKTQIDGINNELIRVKKNSDLKDKFNDIGNSVKNVTKKITGWALAIIGVRTAYNGIRNAISIISQQDEQLAADIQYMKNALAYALEPIVRAIVNLMKQLMFYVGYIVKAWTGKNIFENANKSLKSANKQAKQLSKTLAGFDEMNVLSDTSSGGGDVGALPSFDLSSMQGEVPAWIEWIANNKNIIIPALLGIAAGLAAIKLGLVGLTGGVILGLIVGLVALILTNWDKILEVLSGGIKWLEDSVGAVREFFGDQVADIYETWITAFKGIIIGFDMAINGIKQMLSGIVQFVKGVFTGDWKQAWEGIKNIFSGIWGAIKGLAVSVFSFISGLAVSIAKTVGYTIADTFKAVVNGVLTAVETILNAPIKAVNKLIDVINAVPGIDLGKLPTFKLPRLAKGGIINMPGRGVPVGSAIGGEGGPEGVIPLTDSQQMALLGEAIGKYITMNATIPVYVGNRQIARELRKINAEDEFAFNV